MKIQESAEDYLETILMLKERIGQVRSIDIVNEMGYSKPSVSVAMKRLRENGYIQMDSNGYITLLDAGLEIATQMYDRHKFLAKFLMSIGVNEETALTDACKIEHDISDESYECLKKHFRQYKNK
ncbi:metal-dependent transcriptional regulator [Tissierella praeacuta]|uniref:metal-dependent transcriptional regulator n=1 Tax=Tissierella praeacuta TaxID=43131 RepID=UPI003340250A